MPIAEIDPTGCVEFHGNVQVRLAFYLEPDDARYNERHYLVPIIPPEGYTGEVDEEGNPIDPKAYERWLAGLPHIWQLAPFHNHFIYLNPDVTEDKVKAQLNFHLPNFYAAWLQEADKIPGGMGKGWHPETRKRPTRYDQIDPELYKLKKPQCLEKLALIKKLPFVIRPTRKGEIFPATAIDIGAAAIHRADIYTFGYTALGLDNPANDTGTITSYEVYAATDITGFKAGTLYGTAPDFTPRDVETIGNVTSGSKQTFSGLDIDVTSGDYAGCYWGSGTMRTNSSGFAGVYAKSGDQFGAGQQTYTLYAGDAISLYGTGATAVVGIGAFYQRRNPFGLNIQTCR